MTNCTFTRNEAMYGGAIAMESSAALYSGENACPLADLGGVRLDCSVATAPTLHMCPAENATFVENNAYVFGDDTYVNDPSERALCTTAFATLLCVCAVLALHVPHPPLRALHLPGSSRAYFTPFPTDATVYPSQVGKR